ncbi:LOW QUALITY PROTEIN: queuine tRNA-ribosyltransferase accessory subunit 2 [Glossina fuscipes]|uniref:Queuine tRNA-ribosyltransferase accessory subunit 2 n=1 Tax=Glossina fuscipes TaxID=7396 RepID=A0A8U0W2B7_9MUSC|nr:LOW QUALITY PROTEIN: queuine tRNA-ribosyltransferase accessory subunit 2 [Glossina fuscipes]
MKFVVEHISKNSGRLGCLVHNESGKRYKTPLLLQVTKGGSIPYLSRDVFDRVTQDEQVLLLSLATMDHMSEALMESKAAGINRLSTYIGFKDYLTFLTIRDPCEITPSRLNDKDMVPLFTRRGKIALTAQKYMDLVEIFKPDIYQSLNDADTNCQSAKKRVQKSVERTQQFMNYCCERQQQSPILKDSVFFASIVGGYNVQARSQSIKHIKTKSQCSGYIFEGFHNYGLTACKVSCDQLIPIVEHCMKELDFEKPKMLPGAYTPLVMLELIRLGVDMFDSSYAYCAAINFKALVFTYNKQKHVSEAKTEGPFIDITDECLKEEFVPLLEDCSCLACQKHTRAYMHHLYKTSELLGPILLIIHNLHHMMNFFATIRSTLLTNSLNDLIQLIKYQSGDKQVDYCITANTKVIKKEGLGKGFVNTKS